MLLQLSLPCKAMYPKAFSKGSKVILVTKVHDSQIDARYANAMQKKVFIHHDSKIGQVAKSLVFINLQPQCHRSFVVKFCFSNSQLLLIVVWLWKHSLSTSGCGVEESSHHTAHHAGTWTVRSLHLLRWLLFTLVAELMCLKLWA